MDDLIARPAPPGGVPYLLREGRREDGRLILLLHGYTGDERVMWALAHTLPETATVASLRGLYPAAMGGYQWAEKHGGLEAGVEDFQAAAAAVRAVEEALSEASSMSDGVLYLVGFSQGAAVAFAAAALETLRPQGIVSLAGFLPTGDVQGLRGMRVFWGHGRRDELVPIERARADVERLRLGGAQVHFCEADVGHKLGAECTRGLVQWFQQDQG